MVSYVLLENRNGTNHNKTLTEAKTILDNYVVNQCWMQLGKPERNKL